MGGGARRGRVRTTVRLFNRAGGGPEGEQRKSHCEWTQAQHEIPDQVSCLSFLFWLGLVFISTHLKVFCVQRLRPWPRKPLSCQFQNFGGSAGGARECRGGGARPGQGARSVDGTEAGLSSEKCWAQCRKFFVRYFVFGDRRTEARWIEVRGIETRGTEAMGD